MDTYSFWPLTSRIPNSSISIMRGRLYCDFPEDSDANIKGLPLVASKNNDGWGCVNNLDLMTNEAWSMPSWLELRYVTRDDGHCYAIDTALDDEKAALLWEEQLKKFPREPFMNYIVGTAPFGGIAVWLRGRSRSILLHWLKAEEVELDEIEQALFGWIREGEGYEVISRKELENDMRQFTYRYVACEEHWDWEALKWKVYDDEDPYYDDLDVDSIEDHRTDGTFNYIRGDEDQQRFHTAGKPDRITVRWHTGKTEYLAHFWLSKYMVTAFFNHFFKDEPELKADILLRLDPEQQAYQLALNSENSPKPYIIPWDAYQLIVFKDGVEHFKSPNYQLADGEWSWLWRKTENATETH